MHSSHGVGEAKSVGVGADASDDFEGPKVLLRELL
jgi:hypothetical protein